MDIGKVDLFSLLVFWALVFAVYAVFPANIRAKTNLFVSRAYSIGIFTLTSLLAIVFTTVASIPVCAENPCSFAYLLAANSTSAMYVILVIYAFIALGRIKVGRVSRKNIKNLSRFAENLYRKGFAIRESEEGWNVLIDVLNENLLQIFQVAHCRETWRRLWFGFWKKVKPEFKIVFTRWDESSAAEEKSNTWIKETFDLIISQRIRAALYQFFTRENPNTDFFEIPQSVASKRANLIIKDYVFDKRLLELSVLYKPLFVINIISAAKKEQYLIPDVSNIVIPTLLKDTNSILYSELQEHSYPDPRTTGVISGNLLSLLFTDKKFTDECKLPTPVWDFVSNHLKEIRKAKEDENNSDDIMLYSSEKVKNPIMAVILLYDWIVKSALEGGIHWHMFLVSFSYLQKNILDKMDVTGPNWDDDREFPNSYFYFLYEIFSTFQGWFRFVESSDSVEVVPIESELNSNILKSTSDTLIRMMENLSRSKLPEKYQIYLAEMVWKTYFMLISSKRNSLHEHGVYLLRQLFESLHSWKDDFDYQLFRLMILSFYKIDFIGLHDNSNEQIDTIKNLLLKEVQNQILPRFKGTGTANLNFYLGERAYVSEKGIVIPSYYYGEVLIKKEDL